MRSLPMFLALLALGCDDDPAESDAERNEDVCYDTVDNDDDGQIDCDDRGCASLATCCVGDASETCCADPAEAFDLSFASCTGDVATCAPTLEVLGATSIVADGALAAGAGPGETVVYLGTPLDVAGSAFRITIEAATATDCTGDCSNYQAAGLIPDTSLTPFLGDYTLAVAMRPNRSDAVLMSYGDSIATWTPEPGFHRYALDVRPDGTVSLDEVDAAGVTLSEVVPPFSWGAALPEPLFLASGGRAENIPTGELPARVRSIEMSRSVCDMPDRASGEEEAVIPGPADGVARAVDAAGVEAVVVDVGDAFQMARPDPTTGAYTLATAPLLSLADIPGATGVDQPWLVADAASDRWQLYLTVRTTDGAYIARISGQTGFADALDLATLVTIAEGDADHPTLEGFTMAGDLAIARAVGTDPGGILVRLERDGLDAWAPVGGTLADARIHGPHPDDLFAMDRDEVADPALLEVDGMYRLLFAGRSGSRWSLGLLVSLAGEDWLQPLGAESLWESDAGFDALVQRDPAPWVDDGTMRMLYVGGDGGSSAVGRGSSGTTGTWPVP